MMLILVCSCSGYSDAWEPFAALFNKFWSDCPYEKILLSNASQTDMPGFATVFVDDKGWVSNLREFLRTASHETVLLLQEDFFISDPVRTDDIAEIESWFRSSDYDACRLYPCPGANGKHLWGRIAEITLEAPYRVSCQATIWKRQSLLAVCNRVRNSIQHFEYDGTLKSADLKLAGVIRDDARRDLWPLMYHSTAIVRGMWLKGALDLCRDHGIPVNSTRPIRP